MKKHKYLNKILNLFKKSKLQVAGILLIFIALTALSILFPFITERLIDIGFGEKNFKAIVFYSLSFFTLYIVSSVLTLLKESIRLKLYNNTRQKLWGMALSHLMKIKLNYFDKNNPTNIYQFLEKDIGGIAGIVGEEALSTVSSLFFAIGGCIALFSISWELCILTILYIPLRYLITKILSPKNVIFVKNYITSSNDYSGWFGELIAGIREIRYFELRTQKNKEFKEKQERLITSDYKKQMLLGVHEESQTTLVQALITLIYIVAGIMLISDRISLGGIIAFETYAIMMISPVSDVLSLGFDIAALKPSIIRFFDFIDEPEEKEGFIERCMSYDIEFCNVNFAYNNERIILDNISLAIPTGTKVAIIGDNGVGKTTLINLLLRAISPISGTIKIGGIDISEYKTEAYRSMISVVAQNVFLFNDTVQNNICLGKNINNDEINNIIDRVNLASFIQEKSLNYIAGENGALLSGGQKQKIAIARALAHKTPILILDEATSNLDQESIMIINDLISNELKNVTVICITHETRILSSLDKKYRLEKGGLVQI